MSKKDKILMGDRLNCVGHHISPQQQSRERERQVEHRECGKGR